MINAEKSDAIVALGRRMDRAESLVILLTIEKEYQREYANSCQAELDAKKTELTIAQAQSQELEEHLTKLGGVSALNAAGIATGTDAELIDELSREIEECEATIAAQRTWMERRGHEDDCGAVNACAECGENRAHILHNPRAATTLSLPAHVFQHGPCTCGLTELRRRDS